MKTQLDMTEINKIPKNGYNVVSLFSGCGGSSLGYKLAGFDVKLALEFIPTAAEVYRLNHPNTIVLEKDIRDTTGNEILEAIGLDTGELDILDGSPPCSDFSINGKREAGWGKVKNYSTTKQRVDDLFFEYARLVKEIKPKVIVAENTKGITLGKAGKVLYDVVETIRNSGYIVDYRLLDAEYFNVPQKRERLFIIGVREDLGIQPSFPMVSLPITGKKVKLISTREAIEDLIDKGTDQVEVSERVEQMKKYFHAGCTANDVKRIAYENNLKVFEQGFRRDKWEEPYYTIRQHHTRPFHPKVDRILSIDEAKRIQTFPDDFILPHTPIQNWERIGRAVPPNLMKAIAENVKINILDKIKR